jgi:hypothetical protein
MEFRQAVRCSGNPEENDVESAMIAIQGLDARAPIGAVSMQRRSAHDLMIHKRATAPGSS